MDRANGSPFRWARLDRQELHFEEECVAAEAAEVVAARGEAVGAQQGVALGFLATQGGAEFAAGSAVGTVTAYDGLEIGQECADSGDELRAGTDVDRLLATVGAIGEAEVRSELARARMRHVVTIAPWRRKRSPAAEMRAAIWS